MIQMRKPITCQNASALLEARVVGLARVSSCNLNPSAVDAAIRVAVACTHYWRNWGTQIAQQKDARTSIDQCPSPARRRRTAWDIWIFARSTAPPLRSASRQRFSPPLCRASTFFYYEYCSDCCASGDDVRVAHSCRLIRQSTLGTVERHTTDTRAEMLVTQRILDLAPACAITADRLVSCRRRRTLIYYRPLRCCCDIY